MDHILQLHLKDGGPEGTVLGDGAAQWRVMSHTT